MAGHAQLEITGVSKTYQTANGKPLHALGPIEHLEIGDEICILLGPSGCGKSTLLRQIAGLERPTEGRIEMDGKPIDGPGRERGMVFQKYTSFPWLTVKQNVEYGLKLEGMGRAECEAVADEWISAVGLQEFENAYPETLSGGMQQRVAIARTLAVKPAVVLMDEPFGALDAQTRSEMQQLLLKVWDETASTILFVTHDVEEAVYLADRIFIMSAHPGTIIEDVQVPFDRPRELALKERNEFHELQNYVLGRLRHAPGNGFVRVSV